MKKTAKKQAPGAAAGQKPQHQRRTNAWGIDLTYEDALGQWHDASPDAVKAILGAMGVESAESSAAHQSDPVMVVSAGEQRPIPGGGSIRLESGESLKVTGRLPADLPLGYHELRLETGGESRTLIVSPGKCFLPPELETWGWAVQLYAARSRESWGIGDFADLEKLARWSAELKAGMMLLNPLSAATPITPQQSSPYYPTSRRFFNPLWIHIESVPGAQAIPELEQLAAAGHALNGDRLIQRDEVFRLKMEALELLWRNFSGAREFDAFSAAHGTDLEVFATFCALARQHNSGWHTWPEQYRHPENSEVKQFARDNRRAVDFHKWLQWVLDAQLARSARHLALMQDLPIGVDPDGADAWAWQDVLCSGAAVGAPPDEFNTKGQNWGLPPFVPHKLRARAYQPFIQTIRAAFRNGGGLRIDHVMGLFRLFWIPQGMEASQGTYVRYNQDEMLSIVALESERAQAYVVGEDLGTVEPEAREKLQQFQVLSYRLLWFEKDHPSSFPREALAAVTTHDLPTVAGLWTGSDLEKQRSLELHPNEESTAEIHQRLAKLAGLEPASTLQEVVGKAHELLAHAPSRILTAALDDALIVEERPNMPATMSDKNPNWSIALPAPIEEIMSAPLPRRIAAALKRSKESACTP